uniref:Uncharacterized protein n=1 Tax=Trichobilharzia regenti TaxID=157069 RepID=A0AA85KGC5_TRIRE|nr:unnamed protein product [Trichobilharzia regenti]
MGTLVGLRYGLGRNYTGSLMELNNCGYTTGSCDEEKFQDLIMTSNNNSNDNNNNNSTEPKQPWNNPNDNNNNKLDNLSMALWISKHSRTFGAYEAHLETSSLLNSFALDMHDFSNCHLFTEKPSSSSTSASNSSNAKNLLGLTQLIGLSRLMNFIMYKSRQSNNASSSSSNSNDNNNSNNNNNNSNPLEDAHRQYHGSTFTDYIFARAQMEQKARRRSYYYPILQTLSHSSSLNTSLTCINELKHTGVVDTESFLENFLHKQRKRRHYNSESGLLLPETDNLSTLQNDSQEGGDPQCENNEENNPDYDENTVNLCDDVISSIDSKETETSTLSSEVNMNATESENDSTSESMAENSKSDENVSTSSPSSPSSLCTSVDNDMDNESKVNINKTDPQCAHETVNNTTTTTNPIPNDQSNVITASNIMKSNDAIDDQDGSCDQAEETTIINTSLSKENLKLHKSVSFADEVGKSLTEIFILYDDDDEENEHSHECSSATSEV